MPAAYWDDAPDDLDDREYPDADPWDEDSVETVICPECGTDVYEEADRCPVCGRYMTTETRFWSGKPIWWIALGLLGVMALAAALVLGF